MKHRILVRRKTEGQFDGRVDDIVWDDVTGVVEGSHYDVGWLQKRLRDPFPLEFGNEIARWVLQDPAHNPTDFLGLLGVAVGLEEPAVVLPPSLKDVERPKAVEYYTVPEGWIQ